MTATNYCSPWRGTTTGIATSPVPESLPRLINNFRVVNKTGGSVTVSAYLFSDSYSVAIMPISYQIGQNGMYQQTEPIVQLVTEQIRVEVSGECDFDFTLSNINL